MESLIGDCQASAVEVVKGGGGSQDLCCAEMTAERERTRLKFHSLKMFGQRRM